jgi:hypothetical protein
MLRPLSKGDEVMAENKAGRPADAGQGPKRRDVPLDSSHRSSRDSLDDLQNRRQQLSEEEEMARRNQRSHLMRMKNRLRARR